MENAALVSGTTGSGDEYYTWVDALQGLPLPAVLPGFGHVGLGGCFGWAIPESGLAFAFVHNRLLTPLVLSDQAGFVPMGALVRLGATVARRKGFAPIAEFGSAYDPSSAATAAG